MPKELKYIAQQAQDDYTQSYTGNTSFFTLEDWIYRCGAVLGEYYATEFKAKYAEYRQDKRDEVIAFSTDVLSEQILEVEKNDDGEYFAALTEKAFSFAYDNQNTGFQNVFVLDPKPIHEAQRTSINEIWMSSYAGTINTTFWYPEANRIVFIKQGFCNVKKIKLFYVPSISSDMLVPDGIQEYVRAKSVDDMRRASNGQVIKQSNNLNPNKTIESEMDKTQLRMP